MHVTKLEADMAADLATRISSLASTPGVLRVMNSERVISLTTREVQLLCAALRHVARSPRRHRLRERVARRNE